MRRLLIVLIILAFFSLSAYAGGTVPPNARLISETIANVFRLAPRCRTRDEVQLSIQPLLFVLSRDTGRDAGSVLIELLSYDVGEANHEILRCVIVRRGIADAAFARQFERSAPSACVQALGAGGQLCLSDRDRNADIARIRDSIKKREACELEY